MYFDKCRLTASLVMCLVVCSLCSAQQSTHSEEEMKRFDQFRTGYRSPETTEQYWEAFWDLSNCLQIIPIPF